MKKYKSTIIGFGITGMITLAILNKEKYDLSKVCIIDPYFDGGALIRDYGDVMSNTPLEKTVNALKLIDPAYVLPEWCVYDLDKITPLYVLVDLIKDFTKNLLNQVSIYQEKVISLDYNSSWKIQTESTTLESTYIYLCQGSNPKKLKCNIPTIPLHIALNKTLLKKYVKQNDKIIVFGTSHSGTLVLENLESLYIETKAIYKNKTPFLFASDGIYDGIKEEAEKIGKEILNNKYKHIELININNIDEIIKYTKVCNWSIYATGFERSSIESPINLSVYDSSTGKILNTNNAYGFGIAYPSLAPDTIHYDVGIYSFVEHIQKNLKNNLN